MEYIVVWAKKCGGVSRDPIKNFGRSMPTAFSVRETDPPGSGVEITRLGM